VYWLALPPTPAHLHEPSQPSMNRKPPHRRKDASVSNLDALEEAERLAAEAAAAGGGQAAAGDEAAAAGGEAAASTQKAAGASGESQEQQAIPATTPTSSSTKADKPLPVAATAMALAGQLAATLGVSESQLSFEDRRAGTMAARLLSDVEVPPTLQTSRE